MRLCEGIRKGSVPRASHEQSEQSREDRSRRGMKYKNLKNINVSISCILFFSVIIVISS